MFTKTSLLLTLGVIAVSAAPDQTLDFSSITNRCPNGWSSNTLGDSDTVYCCPGSGIQINDEGACCIGIGTMGPRGSCSTTVQYSDPNYSSIVSSLAAETGSPMSNSDVSMTSMDMSMPTMSMDMSMTGMMGASSAAAQTDSSSTSDGAGAMITTVPVLGLMGAAGAALLL